MIMKNKITKRIIIPLLVLFGGLMLVSSANIVRAEPLKFKDAIDQGKTVLKKDKISPSNVVTQGLQWLMYAVGVVSIAMIIIGGIRYATSGGNAEKVKSAKNTILYACIGLGVALLALAIVNFVDKQTGKLGGTPTTDTDSEVDLDDYEVPCPEGVEGPCYGL